MKYKFVAIFLGALIFALIVGQLIDLNTFVIGSPSDLPSDVNSAVADWLASYRAIDILVQVTLLLAAVLAASAMFRDTNSEVV